MNPLFNNREIATFFWGGLLAFWLFRKKSVSAPFASVFRQMLHWKIFVPFLLLFAYVALCVTTFQRLGVWEPAHLKATIYWTLGSGVVLMMKLLGEERNIHQLKGILCDCFRILVVIEFLVGLYTFALWVELILVPVVALLACMQAVAEHEKKPGIEAVRKLLDGALILIGVIILANTARQIAAEPGTVWAGETFRDFIIPILLTLSFLPFLYLAKLLYMYEMLFVRISIIHQQDPDFQRRVKRASIRACKLNLWALDRWGSYLPTKLALLDSPEDFQSVLLDFKKGSRHA
ncbi:MAG: hypothetical protein WD490_10675 [Opitutales bacterium]